MIRLALAAVAVLTLGSISAATAACLKDNADNQVAEGRLTVVNAKDAAGRPQRPFILQLTGTACLDSSEADNRVSSTKTIHVFSSEDRLQPLLRRLVGKTVRVRGTPFAAHTAHHHAPIVLNVAQIEER